MSELIFRKVVFDELSRYEEIFEQCFGFKASEDYFRWKYLSNPEGEVIAFEAFDPEKNKVAAFYGVMPEAYIIDGQEVRIYQSMDTMTHPEYRNRGLFIKLANMTYDYVCEKDGSALFIGIPGSNSFYGFVKKLHWENPINIRYIFNNTLYLRLRLLFSNDASVSTEEVSEFDSSVNEIFNSHEGRCLVSKKLNSEILNWKFSMHPIYQFLKFIIIKEDKIVGVSIVEKNGKNIRIILYKDMDTSGSIQRLFIKEIAKRFSNHVLFTWESNGNLINNSNKNLFFINPFSKGLFSYRVPFITLIKGDFKNLNVIKNIANFDLYPAIQD
jgi:hypothetical protein